MQSRVQPPHCGKESSEGRCRHRRGENSIHREFRLISTAIAHSYFPQISVCTSAAVLSAVFFLLDYRLLRWRLSGREVDGDRVWKNLRQFSGFLSVGCLSGVVAFSLLLQAGIFPHSLEDLRSGGLFTRKLLEGGSTTLRLFAAFDIFSPLQLLCIIFSMNMLLRRVSDHASHSYYNTARDHDVTRRSTRQGFDWRDCVGQYALYYWVRYMHVIAMVLCALNVVARIVVSAFRSEAAQLLDHAAAETGADGSDTGSSAAINAIVEKYLQVLQRSYASVFAAQVIEASVLVLVAVSFLLIFPAVIVMFRRVERRLDGILQEMNLRSDVGNAFLPFEFSPSGSETQIEMQIVEARRFLRDIKSSAAAQRKRFLFCLLLASTALIALASFATFVAYAIAIGQTSFTSTLNLACGPCESCQSLGFISMQWYYNTPELFPLIYSMCLTLPPVFSLRLMTTPEDRELLMNPSKFLSDRVSEDPTETESQAKLRAERIRMGISLRSTTY